MYGNRKEYRVFKSPHIGKGGCAFVYKAQHRPNGRVVAFKEAFKDDYAKRRMRREVEIQTKLKHDHIMPIIDYDLGGKWFTMPLADGDLSKFATAMGHEERVKVIDQVAQGLEFAHNEGHVHRDVTPANILRLTEGGQSRYVVADWGLVRQPHGHTTGVLTTESKFIGTQGFAAPEMWIDPHAADARADIYSLGRVVAWMVTGSFPVNTQALIPEGPWRLFVRRTTEIDPSQRVQTMGELRKLLAEVTEEKPNATATAPDLAEKARQGDRAATLKLAEMGIDESKDADLFIDYIVAIRPEILLSMRPDYILALITSMLYHLKHDWGHRSFGASEAPLRWMMRIARAAESSNNQGLLEDASAALFEGEAYWKRYEQRRSTRGWLMNLQGQSAQTVARVLRRFPEAALWYLDERWTPTSAEPVIKEALKQAKSE